MRSSKSFSFEVPIYVILGKRKPKKHYLNLNNYRNNGHHLNSNMKGSYHELTKEVIPEGFSFEGASLLFELYLPNRVGRDVSNVLCIVDKFVTDTLVVLGVLEDDSFRYIQDIHYSFKGFDESGEGYVRVTVEEVHNGDLIR